MLGVPRRPLWTIHFHCALITARSRKRRHKVPVGNLAAPEMMLSVNYNEADEIEVTAFKQGVLEYRVRSVGMGSEQWPLRTNFGVLHRTGECRVNMS